MAGRDLRPRPRPQRPLGHRPEGPRDRWAPPVPHQGGWAVPPKLGQRLYEKSKLGRLDGDGNLVLSSEEVLFCHWNRHVSLPSEAWLEEELEGDPNLLQRAVILDVARSGGKSSSSMTLTRLAGACGGPVMQSHLPLPKPWPIGPRLQQTSIGRPSFRTLILTMLKVASVNGTSSMRSLMSPCITFTRWPSQVPSLLGRSLRNNNAMASAMLGRSKSHAEMDTGSQ